MNVQQFMKMQQAQGQGQQDLGRSSLQKFNQDLNSSHAMKSGSGQANPIQQLLGAPAAQTSQTSNASVQNQIQSILTRKPAAPVTEQPVQEFFMQAQQAQMQNSPPMVRLANALQGNNRPQNVQQVQQTQVVGKKQTKTKSAKHVNNV